MANATCVSKPPWVDNSEIDRSQAAPLVGLQEWVGEMVLDFERRETSVVLLADDEQVLAVFAVADVLRDSSRQALGDLHALGVETVILSGDNQRTVDFIATLLQVKDARGGLLPHDKLSAIRDLVRRYKVVGMVGDGINDSPALAAANIGFAMGAAGSDAALETADVALMDNDLRKLPAFIRLSRQTTAILAENIALALTIKGLFFALAIAGMASLWMAVSADMGVSLLVVLNGLRLLRTGSFGPRGRPDCTPVR